MAHFLKKTSQGCKYYANLIFTCRQLVKKLSNKFSKYADKCSLTLSVGKIQYQILFVVAGDHVNRMIGYFMISQLDHYALLLIIQKTWCIQLWHFLSFLYLSTTHVYPSLDLTAKHCFRQYHFTILLKPQTIPTQVCKQIPM